MNADHLAATDEPSSLLWTLEEIGDLVSRSGNPTETLTNVVNLIQRRFATDVCSVYLLEPDRANLVLAATIGSARRERRPGAHAAHRRARRPRRRAGAARRRARHDHASAVQVLPGRGRGSVSHLPRRAGDGPRRAAGRARRADGGSAHLRRRRRADAGGGRRAAGADRQRGARRRAVRGAGAPAAGGDRAEPLVELGRREREPVPRPRSGRSGASATTIRSRCCSAPRSISSSCARRSWRCTAASTTRTGGCRST